MSSLTPRVLLKGERLVQASRKEGVGTTDQEGMNMTTSVKLTMMTEEDVVKAIQPAVSIATTKADRFLCGRTVYRFSSIAGKLHMQIVRRSKLLSSDDPDNNMNDGDLDDGRMIISSELVNRVRKLMNQAPIPAGDALEPRQLLFPDATHVVDKELHVPEHLARILAARKAPKPRPSSDMRPIPDKIIGEQCKEGGGIFGFRHELPVLSRVKDQNDDDDDDGLSATEGAVDAGSRKRPKKTTIAPN
jgi:hypothetical protein